MFGDSIMHVTDQVQWNPGSAESRCSGIKVQWNQAQRMS